MTHIGPACPHGKSLDDFCRALHKTTWQNAVGTTCPHGTSLDLFCRKLHHGDPR